MEVNGELELTLTIRLGVDEFGRAVPLIEALRELGATASLTSATSEPLLVVKPDAVRALPAAPPEPKPEKRCPPHHYVYPSPSDAPGDTAVGVCKHCGRKKSAANVGELALIDAEKRRRGALGDHATAKAKQRGGARACKNCHEMGHLAKTCQKAAA